MKLAVVVCIIGLVLFAVTSSPRFAVGWLNRAAWWAYAVGLIFVLYLAGQSDALPALLKG